MIELHRLAQEPTPFQLNPDLIFTIEANPDTVITLTTGAKIVVTETPDDVATSIREYRVRILSEALRRRRP